jgi:hypothetical protein
MKVKMNKNKIIAREGLIIISISLLFGALLVFNNIEQEKKGNFENGARIVEIVELASGGKNSSESKISYHTGIYIMLQKPTDLIRIQEVLKHDFPNVKNPSFIEWDDQNGYVSAHRYYDSNGKKIVFTNYWPVILLAVFLYPIYWLVRFIFWSVRTLRQ